MPVLDDFPIISRFDGVQVKSSTQAYARCPAHEDSRQSLGIGVGDKTGNLGLRCFAGCSTDEILRAVGGTYADLCINPKTDRSDGYSAPLAIGGGVGRNGPTARTAISGGKKARRKKADPGDIPGSKSRIVAAYDYRDESGALLFQVCRLEPKDFRQRQPDPRARGGWKWSTSGVRKVLYRLPQIIAAAEELPEEAVWILEGEKDADLLSAVGAVATTNPGGAGKWTADFSEALRDRAVAIVPDEDPVDPRTGRRPGVEHARAVAQSLHGIARSVRIVWLSAIRPEINPSGKIDLGKWVAAGGTPQELNEAYTKAVDGWVDPPVNHADADSSDPAALAPWESGPPAWTPDTPIGTSPPTPPGSNDLAVDPDDGDSDPVPYEEDDDPHRLARLYLDSLSPRSPEGYSCRYWADQFWFWNGRSYYQTTDSDVRCRLTRVIKREFDRLHLEEIKANPPAPGQPPSPTQKVENSLVGNTLQALKSICQVTWTDSQPSWIPLGIEYGTSPALLKSLVDEGRTGVVQGPLTIDYGTSRAKDRSPHDFVSMTNGILDLEYLVAPTSGNFGDPDTFRDPVLPHTPRFFTPVSVGYQFNPDAECARWLAFLEKNLEGDRDRICMLQEWFGYCLTFDTSFQRFLFLEGEGSNGKSVICAALAALLGPDNVCHVPLESFGKEFALATTLGKLANIVAEVGEIDKVAEGSLKSFTSGDRMSFNRKNLPYLEATPSARLILSTNNRPRFSDRSGGLWRRMLILPLNVQIQRHERIHGMDKPDWWAASGELPGMFNWSLAGLMRLRDNKEFTIGAATKAALEDYRHEANPARAFLTSEIFASQHGQITTFEVFDAYRDWCDRSGYRPLSVCQFGKEIPRAFPAASPCYIRIDSGRVARGYRGLAFRTSSPESESAFDAKPEPETTNEGWVIQ